MFLYLLRFQDGERFKIGIANTLENRISGLGSKNFDLTLSKAFEAAAKVIKSFEKQLHIDFENFRCSGDGLSSGHTEVFSMECWDSVCQEIQDKITKFPQHNIKAQHGISINSKSPAVIKQPKKELINLVKTENLREFLAEVYEYAETIAIVKNYQGDLLGFELYCPADQDHLSAHPQLSGRRFRSNIFKELAGISEDETQKLIYPFSAGYPEEFGHDRINRYLKRVQNFMEQAFLKNCPDKVVFKQAEDNALINESHSILRSMFDGFLGPRLEW